MSRGNIYTTGHNYKSGYGNEVTLVKHNSSGTQQWEVTLSTAGSESGYGVTVDSSNNIYVTGYTNGALDGNSSSGKGEMERREV